MEVVIKEHHYKNNDNNKDNINNNNNDNNSNEYYPYGRRTKVTPEEKEELEEQEKNEKKNIEGLEKVIREAIEVRIDVLPIAKDKKIESSRLGILFSGGIDSMLIARLVDTILPIDVTVDLFNVAFEMKIINKKQTTTTYDVPDRLTGIEGLHELQYEFFFFYFFLVILS